MRRQLPSSSLHVVTCSWPCLTSCAVFVPVGGGGLIAGISSVLKAADPAIRVVGCQPAASDVMRQSVATGRVVDAEWRATLSEATVGGLEPDAITLEPCTRFVDGEDKGCQVGQDSMLCCQSWSSLFAGWAMKQRLHN